jgi:hypothetical protein
MEQGRVKEEDLKCHGGKDLGKAQVQMAATCNLKIQNLVPLDINGQTLRPSDS